MNKHVMRGLLCTAVAGGLWAAGTAVASAADTDEGSGLLDSGSSAVDILLPVTLTGNAVGGDDASTTGADSSITAPSTATSAPASTETTSDPGGLLGGGSSAVVVSVPVTVTGNAVSLLGDATSEDAASMVAAPAAATSEATEGSNGSTGSDGSSAVAVSTPVTATGNAVSVLGDAHASDATSTVAAPAAATSTSSRSDSSESGSSDGGLLSGGSSAIGVAVPVTVTGNAVSVLGDAVSEDATSTVHAPASAESLAGSDSSGSSGSSDEGLLSGGSSAIGVAVPVTVTGNAVSVLGDAVSEDATSTVDAPASAESLAGSDSSGSSGSSDEGLLSGGSSAIGVSAPVTLTGNAVSVLGDAVSEDATSTVHTPATATSHGSSEHEGLLSGGSSIIAITAPVTLTGNAVAVLGDAVSTGATSTVTTDPPTTPTTPTTPTVPTTPTPPTVPTPPTTPTTPGETPTTGGPGTTTPTTGGSTPAGTAPQPGKADAPSVASTPSAASLPVTGAETMGPGLGLALAAMLLGLLLMLGARLRTRLQRS